MSCYILINRVGGACALALRRKEREGRETEDFTNELGLRWKLIIEDILARSL